MMKKLTGLLGAAAILAILSGCSAHSDTKRYVSQPVVKSVKKGMTREQVQQIAGTPSTEITMVHAKGTCQTYMLGKRDGKPKTYFVSYNNSGNVMNYGFQSCKDYDTDPQVQQ